VILGIFHVYSIFLLFSIHRKLVLENKIDFDKCKCEEFRRHLILKVIRDLSPGRFLRPSKVDGQQDTYDIMSQEKVYKKVFNAMRDCCATQHLIDKALLKIRILKIELENGKKNSDRLHRIKTAKKKLTNITKEKRNSTRPNLRDNATRKKRRKSNNDVPEVKIVNRLSEGKKNCCRKLESAEAMSTDCVYMKDDSYEQQIFKLSSRTYSDVQVQVTTEQITHFIEQMVHKGALRRRKNPNVCDDGWFSAERQRLVRMQLLKRCYAAMKSTLR